MMNHFRIVDLTHSIRPDMPVWPGDPPTRIEPAAALLREGYALNRLIIGEHSGTHTGAPCHLIAGAADMASIPAWRLVLPVVKLDFQSEASSTAKFLVSPEHISRWERGGGTIAAGSAILIETGWDVCWRDTGRYFGENFPGIEPGAAELLAKRGVAAIGIDSPGVDGGDSRDFAANRTLAESGALHLENLTNLNQLPLSGAWVFIGALPIVGGSGSPARILALVP